MKKSDIIEYSSSKSKSNIDRSSMDVIGTKLDLSSSKKQKINTSYTPSNSQSFGIFKLFLLILIILAIIRILYSGSADTISFSSLLDLLAGAPQVSTAFKNFSLQLTIIADWGIFNFLRDFINLWVKSFSVLNWIFLSLIDVLVFISYFLYWLFV